MRILYVGKHGPRDNQDEDAITHGFRRLGHSVDCIGTVESHVHIRKCRRENFPYDFILFNNGFSGAGKLVKAEHQYFRFVLWNFDMVSSDDPEWRSKSQLRRQWMNEITPYLFLGFCSDGDWVAQDRSGTLIHMMQGADERYVGYGDADHKEPPVIFTGSPIGVKRKKCLELLKAKYKECFALIGDTAKTKYHGRELANIFASTKVVVAPDGPCTDRYWSNRVYLTLGLGGFLIHPYCRELMDHYTPEELTYYNNQEELHSLIDHYLYHPEEREARRLAGHQKTLSHHLYRHRCEQLVRTVQERM
jgi:hypothetical protein